MSLNDLDATIHNMLEAVRASSALLADLERHDPHSSRWREAAPYQSQLALARRRVTVDQLALRAARLRALNTRLERIRNGARPQVASVPTPGELFPAPTRPFSP